MSAVMQIAVEEDVLSIERVYGYAPVLPPDQVLKDTYDGIEAEIRTEKNNLKLLTWYSRFFKNSEAIAIRSRIRKLQVIQEEIELIRTMA